MKKFNWNSEKNRLLSSERDICFEHIIFHLQNDGLLDDIEHPNKNDYPNQRIFVVNIENYAFLVPYIETEEEIFLKTIIPSRKATKKYLGDKHGKN